MNLIRIIPIFLTILCSTAAYSNEVEVKEHVIKSLQNIVNTMHLRTKYEVGEPRDNHVNLSHLINHPHLPFLEHLVSKGFFEKKIYETEKVKKERLELEAIRAEEERKRREAEERCKKKGGFCLQGGTQTIKLWDPSRKNKGWVLEYVPVKSSIKSTRTKANSETEEFNTFRLGVATTVRVIDVQQVMSTASCDWRVRVRTWYKYPSVILEAVFDYTGLDGYVQENCYYYGSKGLIWKYNDAVFR